MRSVLLHWLRFYHIHPRTFCLLIITDLDERINHKLSFMLLQERKEKGTELVLVLFHSLMWQLLRISRFSRCCFKPKVGKRATFLLWCIKTETIETINEDGKTMMRQVTFAYFVGSVFLILLLRKHLSFSWITNIVIKMFWAAATVALIERTRQLTEEWNGEKLNGSLSDHRLVCQTVTLNVC